MSLTPNSTVELARGGSTPNTTYEPIVQIIDVRKVTGSGGGSRYRVIVSDGQTFLQGMLATQLNSMIHDNSIVPNVVVKVKEYITNLVQNKTVVILLRVEVLNNPGQKFGNPKEYSGPGSASIENNLPGVGGGGAPQSMYGNNAMVQKHQQPQQVNSFGGNNRMNTYNNNNSMNTYNNNSNGNDHPRNTYGGGGNSAAPIVRSNDISSSHHIPISNLNMYQNRWTIKARITSKSEIRTWSNARGEGSLFSVELLDHSGTDIRATFFKEAVERFYSMLQVDQVYTLSGGRLKVANQQFNTCKSGFEITFDQNAEIHLVGNDPSIQQGSFDFVKIAQLEQMEPNSTVDILGVIKSVSPVNTVMSRKTGSELFKSDLILIDDSNAEVNCTVWGERAKTAEQDYANQPIVAFKKLRISDYGGRSVSVAGGLVLTQPRLPEVDSLRQWWNTKGCTGMAQIRSLSGVSGGGGRADNFEDRKTIASIKMEQMGFNEKPDWLSFQATFNFIKKDKEGGPWYTACFNSEDPCKNRPKVTQTTDMFWHCDKCNQTNPKCVRRFIFSATLIDDTSCTWVTLFDEQARLLLGEANSADDLYAKYFEHEGDLDGFDAVFSKATFTEWIVKCKVKQEMVGDEARVRTTVYSMQPVDYAKESRELLKAIQSLG